MSTDGQRLQRLQVAAQLHNFYQELRRSGRTHILYGFLAASAAIAGSQKHVDSEWNLLLAVPGVFLGAMLVVYGWIEMRHRDPRLLAAVATALAIDALVNIVMFVLLLFKGPISSLDYLYVVFAFVVLSGARSAWRAWRFYRDLLLFQDIACALELRDHLKLLHHASRSAASDLTVFKTKPPLGMHLVWQMHCLDDLVLFVASAPFLHWENWASYVAVHRLADIKVVAQGDPHLVKGARAMLLLNGASWIKDVELSQGSFARFA